jgi:alpha-glucosidase (family GH31 glycosyl hydrolase)
MGKAITITFTLISLVLLQAASPRSFDPNDQNSAFLAGFDSSELNNRILQERANNYRITMRDPVQEVPFHEGVDKYSLEYTGQDTTYGNGENPIVKNADFTVEHHAPTQIRFKITDSNRERWEVPNRYPFPNFGSNFPTNDEAEYDVKVQNEPFGFAVIRKSTQEVILDTRPYGMTFSDLYIDWTSAIPTDNLFGLGERSSRFKMGPSGTYSIWARDKPEVIDRGVPGGHVYGHHPVYLMQEKSGNWHVVLFRSSNAMDVSMEQGKSVRFRVAGGIIDVAIFLGGQYPESAIEQYHDYVGHWTVQPFWSLGFHQSRWGYYNLQTLKDKVNKYREIQCPIDVIWSDLDYMIDKEDFTIDSNKFPFDDFNSWLKSGKIRWVPIIDAGVSRKYRHEQGYDEGIKRDVFIKNKDGGVMLGTVWPGDSHYVDWFHPEAENYWADMLERLYTRVKFDGIWLDMNEPTNFANGEVGKQWESSKYDRLPYTPGGQQLKTMTISMDGKHHGGILEFDVHDLFGTLESKATFAYLKKKSPLPFILTRSSTFGAGQFAAHWTGDNGASWDFMKYGTTGVFQFGIFGMPFTGADICGFMGSTTPELCARWFQSGLLYPFARNHNHLEARDQEAYAFNEPNIRETAVKAVQLRYSIMKWYYAQFIEKKGRGLVFKPVFYEFPNEDTFYRMDVSFTDEQIMLGKALMATPVYQPNRQKVSAYFPRARWFNYFTGETVHDSFEIGSEKEIEAPLGDYVPMFIRGGFIVHKQETKEVQWSEDLGNRYTLVVAFNNTTPGYYEAQGFLMGVDRFDDSTISDRCLKGNCLIDIIATAERNPTLKTLKIKIDFHPRDLAARLDQQYITAISMYGLHMPQTDQDFSGTYRLHGAGKVDTTHITSLRYETKKGLFFKEQEIQVLTDSSTVMEGLSLEIEIGDPDKTNN